MESVKPDQRSSEESAVVESRPPSTAAPVTHISVYQNRPEGYDGTCLRPLGLCELGGSCDACWYSPDHPRFKKRAS
jgi:hypothetical protein